MHITTTTFKLEPLQFRGQYEYMCCKCGRRLEVHGAGDSQSSRQSSLLLIARLTAPHSLDKLIRHVHARYRRPGAERTCDVRARHARTCKRHTVAIVQSTPSAASAASARVDTSRDRSITAPNVPCNVRSAVTVTASTTVARIIACPVNSRAFTFKSRTYTYIPAISCCC